MTLAMAIVGDIGPANVRKQSEQAVFFEKSNITLRKWLLIIHYYSRQLSIMDAELQLKIKKQQCDHLQLNVTRYEKIDHSQANMILQYRVQYLTQHYFFSLFSLQNTKVWSFLYSLAKFHANPSLFSDGNSLENGSSILASYVNGLTVLLINKNLQTANPSP